MLLTIRGGACVYQGEELGLTEAEIDFSDLQDPFGIEFWPDFKGRDGCRTPMPWSSFSPNGGFSEVRPWLPVSPEHLRLAVDQQEKDPDSVLHMFRRFVAWRKGQPALIRGAIRLLPSDGTILAFERPLDRDCILCIFNFSNHEAFQELEAEWQPIAEARFRSSLDSGRVYLHPFGAWFGAARLSHG